MTKDEALKMALGFVASISPEFICEATHHAKKERHGIGEPCPHVATQKATYEAIKEALAQPEQEPVAWMHTKLDGVVVPHRPADLDRRPDRWEALYKNTQPCPTCEALARTVMLDQTSHDTTTPQRTWVGLTEDDKVLIKHDANFNQFMTAGEYADRVQQLTEARLKDLNT